MGAGRPTEYNEEILVKSREYINQCMDEIEDWVKTDGDKSTTYQKVITVKLPTIEGLALHLGVARSTVYEWEGKYKEFSDTLDEINILQKQRLIEMGLSGMYNPLIAKLILSSNHGMKEKSDITTNGKELPQPILDVRKDNSNGENS